MRLTEQEYQQKLSLEVLEILFSHLVLRDLTPNSSDALQNLKTMKLIDVLYRDCVLRLCKLTDSRRRTLGAPQLVRHLKRISTDAQQVTKIKAALNALSSHTEKLKHFRDNRLAHIGEVSSSSLMPLPSLVPALHAAVELIDTLAKQRVAFTIRDLDLRAAVFSKWSTSGIEQAR